MYYLLSVYHQAGKLTLIYKPHSVLFFNPVYPHTTREGSTAMLNAPQLVLVE